MVEKKVVKQDKKIEDKKIATDSSRAVGRRKCASARVRLVLGKGEISVNGRKLDNYFPNKLWQEKVSAPLSAVGKEKNFDVSVKVAGGGGRGQADAICHGLARALVEWEKELKPVLKAQGFLTRDSRVKERKKFGLYKARRAHQWKKR